jgi:putative ABC transport system permease protein
MQTSTLLKHSLTYYWRTNLAVVFGVATAVAVLAGALVVGDSVRGSLRDLFLARLGNTDYVISSTSFFREQLAADVESHEQFSGGFISACPLIVFEGVVTHEKSKRRSSAVQVFGVDDRFWRLHGRQAAERSLEDNTVFVSAGLAQELGCSPTDALLLTIEKPSEIPAESLHGRKDDLGRTIRLSLAATLTASKMGDFSIRPDQGTARSLFVSMRRLQKDLSQQGKVNAMLVSARGPGQDNLLENIIRERFALEDLGLRLRPLEERRALALESDGAIISDALADTALAAAKQSGLASSPVLTYLANTIRANGREIPYSVVTALDKNAYASLAGAARQSAKIPARPILLNDWAARDLGARPGDRVELEYFLWEKEGRLATKKAEFSLAGVVPLEGAAADRDLVPDYPGITEAESVSEWDPPFPVDLNRVRPVDEDYWHKHRATPKAFILIEDGQQLWQSRYGKITSIRLIPPGERTLAAALANYRQSLRAALDPIVLGLAPIDVKAEGIAAARGATDFGEYFLYFSFFIVVSALMLVGLFFKLGIEQRLREIGLLRAVGLNGATIRNLFLTEGGILAGTGSMIGLGGAILYGWLMMLGLKTWWVGAVGTQLLALHVSWVSLLAGGLGGILAAVLCIALVLRGIASASPRSLLAGVLDGKSLMSEDSQTRAGSRRRAVLSPRFASIVFGLLGHALLVAGWAKWIGQAAGFFGAGTMLLVAFLFYQSARLREGRGKAIKGNNWWSVSKLGLRNARYRPGRSVLCVALIASATFIIVAVDAFRRGDSAELINKNSGTGGFPLLAQSVVPLVPDPNSADGKESLNMVVNEGSALDGVIFTRFRLRPGDDASCLNLYRPTNPRILAPTDDFIQSRRFAFQDSLAATGEEKENPWSLLNRDESDGAVPVIVDANSMTYVLHLKLGDVFNLDRGAGNTVRLRLVGALADSIFQGEMLMSEKNFIRLFPDQQGYRFFLIDSDREKLNQVATTLEDQLSDFGFDVVETGERLASFHRVENTYLSTFQMLGGLGLMLGTLGLATVLLRNVLERRRELALLRAVGYNSSHFTLMVVAENTVLLLSGLTTGTLCALLAIAPAFFSRGGHFSMTMLGLIALVLVVGLAASFLATVAALRTPLLAALRAE